jgi:hypothetical protein
MSNLVVLRPLRFTADVQAMRKFLETLGLRSRVESERGGWVDMVAGQGMAALHDSAISNTGGRSGETRLSFEADDIDELAQRLQEAGYDDATVWDEAYGRVLSVTGPGNTTIQVDQRSDDLYGYKLHDARPDERWSVTQSCRSPTSPPGSASSRLSAATLPSSSPSEHRRRSSSYGLVSVRRKASLT